MFEDLYQELNINPETFHKELMDANKKARQLNQDKRLKFEQEKTKEILPNILILAKQLANKGYLYDKINTVQLYNMSSNISSSQENSLTLRGDVIDNIFGNKCLMNELYKFKIYIMPHIDYSDSYYIKNLYLSIKDLAADLKFCNAVNDAKKRLITIEQVELFEDMLFNAQSTDSCHFGHTKYYKLLSNDIVTEFQKLNVTHFKFSKVISDQYDIANEKATLCCKYIE